MNLKMTLPSLLGIKNCLLFCCCLLALNLIAQDNYAPLDIRLQAFEQRQSLQANSILGQIPFESVGPSVFGGRVVDLAVNPDQPSEFFVAYASSGLWHTHSNGTAFTPMFEDQAVITIGDIAVDWKHDIIWIGTGENNSSRSSYAGVGMYCSRDKGKTWEHKGLPESHHIGRIVLHPTDTNTLWVAVLGHLYSPNEERGIFKTTDGGKTWNKVLFVDDNTGGIDLVMADDDPSVLYAAMWNRERRAWNFVESGKGSGIYKSTDGGENWVSLSGEGSGFPSGEGVGRIGLAVNKQGGKRYLYA